MQIAKIMNQFQGNSFNNHFKLCLYLILLQIVVLINADVKITTKLGSVSGTLGKTLDHRDIHQFLGIPYAKPPVGPLRFFPIHYLSS